MDQSPTGPRWEGMGEGTVPSWLRGLCRTLPEQLFVLYDPHRRSYCYRKIEATEDCGLLAFSEAHLAHAYAASCLRGTGYSQVWQVSLDDAFRLARERHAVVNSVLLVDDPRHPVVNHVR